MMYATLAKLVAVVMVLGAVGGCMRARPGRVQLEWAPSPTPNVQYHVYRGGNAENIKRKLTADPVAQPWFVDHEVKPGKTYYYAVSAVSPQGVESQRSEPVRAVARAAGAETAKNGTLAK